MCYNNLNALASRRVLDAQKTAVENRAQTLQELSNAILSKKQMLFRQKQTALQHAAAVAESLNPYGVLARGYTIVRDRKGQCRTVDQLKAGQEITLQGIHVTADCTVNTVRPLSGEDQDENAQNFEEGLARLQQILQQMQDETTTLDKSVKLYAEAAQLIAYCNTTLENAKLQMEEIDAAAAPKETAGE